MAQVVKATDVDIHDRGEYQYQRYIPHGEGVPYNFLRIVVDGRHVARRVLAGTRHYYVVVGNGRFFINDDVNFVFTGDLIIIRPGEPYSYEGEMELVEFNIDTGDGIAHEDVD